MCAVLIPVIAFQLVAVPTPFTTRGSALRSGVITGYSRQGLGLQIVGDQACAGREGFAQRVIAVDDLVVVPNALEHLKGLGANVLVHLSGLHRKSPL